MKTIKFLLVIAIGVIPVRGEESARKTLFDEFRTQIADAVRTAEGMHSKLTLTSQELERVGDLSEANKAKLDSFIAETRQAKLGTSEFKADLESLKAEAEKSQSDLEKLKELLTKYREETKKLDALEATTDRLAKAPDEFKAFTAMKGRRLRADVIVEVEAQRDGKQIPLSGKAVVVSLQHKDGPLQKLETVMSDPDGVVRVTRPNVKDKPSPMYLAFTLSGDESNRPCHYRIQIR